MVMSKKTGSLMIGLVSMLAVACGTKNSGSDDSADGISGVSPGETELVAVAINISDTSSSLSLSNGQGLGLTATAEDFSLDIVDCATGYTNTGITTSSAPLNVYKGDIGCLAKLKSLTLGGLVYTPSTDFTSWQAGDTAVFSNGSDILNLSIQSTLNDPISGTEAISIAFTEIEAGSDTLVSEAALGDSYSVSVSGESAPAFQVTDYALNGVTANGAGQFRFTLQCEEGVVGTGSTATCATQTISSLTYVLLQDT